MYWIGLIAKEEGQATEDFEWQTGERINYILWCNKFFREVQRTFSCATIYNTETGCVHRQLGGFLDFDCNDELPYICQMTPEQQKQKRAAPFEFDRVKDDYLENRNNFLREPS